MPYRWQQTRNASMAGVRFCRRGKLGMNDMPPTLRNGKICYIQIPATDIARSADFYRSVFGWNIRQREHGTAFDDGVGEVSGEWVLDRPPALEPGLLIDV